MSVDPSSWLAYGRSSTGFVGLRHGARQILQATEGINWEFLSQTDHANKSSELAALLVRLTGHTPQPLQPVQALQEFRFIADHRKPAIDADRGQFAYMILELRAFAYMELALRCSRKSYGGITDNPVKLACRRVQDAVHTVECSKESKLKQQDSENKVPWAIKAWKRVDLSAIFDTIGDVQRRAAAHTADSDRPKTLAGRLRDKGPEVLLVGVGNEGCGVVWRTLANLMRYYDAHFRLPSSELLPRALWAATLLRDPVSRHLVFRETTCGHGRRMISLVE